MAITAPQASHADIPTRAMRRVTHRLVPFLCVLFIVNYLDRANVAMAKLTMLPDAHLTEAAYGLGSGLFFIGYFLFEVPSNLILHRVGAKRWIARIMITWGLCSAAMALTRGPSSFYAIRFFLGVAEAGFFPGIVLYLTHWVPARRRARVFALFLTSTATSGVIGNPLSGGLLRLDGFLHLHGWQWLFILEGLPPILLGLAILWMNLLPERPADATWLGSDERDWLEMQVQDDRAHESPAHVNHLRAAAMDARLWLLSAIYFMLVMGLYGFVFWVPTIVKMLTGYSNGYIGLISALPYMVAVVAMVIIGEYADRAGNRRHHVAGCAVIGAGGLCLLCVCHHPIACLAALCLAAIGIFGSLGPFWAIPTRYLRDTAAAGGIAVINSVGALSGFVVNNVMGSAKEHGNFCTGLLIVAASLAIGAILVLCVPGSIDRNDA